MTRKITMPLHVAERSAAKFNQLLDTLEPTATQLARTMTSEERSLAAPSSTAQTPSQQAYMAFDNQASDWALQLLNHRAGSSSAYDTANQQGSYSAG
jgi:hypothetical protein